MQVHNLNFILLNHSGLANKNERHLLTASRQKISNDSWSSSLDYKILHIVKNVQAGEFSIRSRGTEQTIIYTTNLIAIFSSESKS